MTQPFETVPYGRPATEALLRALDQAKAAGPLSPVTVVVESNLVGLSLRRLLGSGQLGGSGLANVSFLTALRLAELLAPDTGDQGQPLTNPVLAASVRRVLKEDPGPLASVAEHPATEGAVAALYAELSHVSPDTLDTLAGVGGITATSVRLFRGVSSHLGGFTGEPELAAAVAHRHDLAEQIDRVGTIVWFLPGPLTPSLERMMKAVIAALPSVVIVGVTGDESADEPVFELCGRAGIDLGAWPGAVPGGGQVPDAPFASEVISVADPDEEVRSALRWVLARAEEGVPLNRIGIFYPTPDPYVRVIRQHLDHAGIPGNGPSRERLADSAAGRTLLAALRLPDERWRRDRVMALVATAPVRNGAEPVRPAAWENLSRLAGVVQGLDDWRHKISGRRAHLAKRRSLAEGDADADREQRRAEAFDREDADLAQLLGFVEGLAEQVAAVSGAVGWEQKADAAKALLVHLLGPEPRHGNWPEAEQQAATRVVDVLSRLSLLDPLDPQPSHGVFVRALIAELEVGRGRDGKFGEGLTYGPLASAPGHDLDAVVVLGMAEGICPARRRDDSLLPDAARQLAPEGDLSLRSADLSRQHRCLLAALAAAPPERRLLVHPRGSQRSKREHQPSRWLLDSLSALASERVFGGGFKALGPTLVHRVASHSVGLRTAAVPLSLAERDLAELSDMPSGGAVLDHPGVGPAADRGVRTLAARMSADFTAYDGNLAGLPIPSPTRDGARLSATGLEGWAVCGFRYFCSHVLDLASRDDPERIHRVEARERGSVVHRVLERFLDEVLAEGAPDPDTPWTAEQRRRAREIAEEELDALEQSGKTGRPLLWRIERERLLRLVDSVLDTDDTIRAEWGATPERIELPFGLDEAPPVSITLDDGRRVQFRGKADRVDITRSGRRIVLDYKTGSGKKYEKLAADPFNEGTTLQLGLYAEAARQQLGEADTAAHYWMVEATDASAMKGYDWTDEHRTRFLEVVGAMVEGIDAGVFVQVPGEFDSYRGAFKNCQYCDFNRVCPSDRGDYAEAKAEAPQLAVRVRLLPPVAAKEEVEP